MPAGHRPPSDVIESPASPGGRAFFLFEKQLLSHLEVGYFQSVGCGAAWTI